MFDESMVDLFQCISSHIQFEISEILQIDVTKC